MNIAELMAKTLANAGVKRIWGVTGDSLNGLNEALRQQGRIDWLMTRHEEVAAFAAGAEATITGTLAVCAGSCGPGNLHLINGLFDCHRNHVPVLAIAAHIPSSEIGLGYFQETHPQELFRECSHFVELVSNPAQMPEVMHRAMRAAIGKRGVAVIVVPGDVALKDAPQHATGAFPMLATPRLVPDLSEVDAIVDILGEARKIALFCGSGCAGLHDQVIALADRLGAPIIHALRGKEYLEWDNPFDVGMTGLIGFSSGYHAMENCDALLMLGTDFPYRNFYPRNAKIIQVDRDPAQLGKRAPLALGVVGDIGETLDVLLPRIEPRAERGFLEAAKRHYASAREGLDDLERPSADGKPIHPQYLAHKISEIASEEAIISADVGTPTVWAARHIKVNGRRRLLFSGNHGSMANALGQAMGAQAASPGRQVISFSGDGGFSMSMGDLLSLRQLSLPVKIVIVDNGELGFVALEQKAGGFLDVNVKYDNPDFAAIASAAGILGISVRNAGDLDHALRTAFEHDGPAVVAVKTAPAELAMPPAIKLEQAKGFSLYMLKAILNGRGNEIVELAETNFK